MRKDLHSSNFLIVGLARNCERVIHEEVKKINDAFSEAASIKWLIIESDSDDLTIEKLDSFGDNLKIRYITLGRLQKKYPKRTERLALCRNRYLEEIRDNPEYKNINYVVVADLDGVNSELTAKSVNTCWECDVNWDACFANQSAPYYDIWALRHDLWSPADCFEQEKFFKNFGINDFNNRYVSILSKMICIPPTSKPIKVKSAFGGLGIYKKNVITDCRYSGLNKNRNEICEHVSFNMQIKNKGYKLYIMPTLINGGWNEHNSNLKIYKRINKKLYYYIIKFVTIFISKQKLKNYLEKLLNLTGR